MSELKYNGLKRMLVNDEVVLQKDFIHAVMAKVELNEELIKLAMKRAQGLDIPDPEGVDDKTLKTITQVQKLAKNSFDKAAEILAARKEEAQNEQTERSQRKDQFIAAYTEAEPSEAIAIPVTSFVDTKVAEALGDSFSVDPKTGKIELKKGADAIKAFGSGFRSLNELFDKSSELGEGFAIYEARLGLAAKEAFGTEWPNALAGAGKKDIVRIRKNMRAIEIYTDLGFSLNNVPIGTLRVLTEASYDKEDADSNNAIKKKVIKDFVKKSEAKGSPLNQIEARELVAQATPQKVAESRKHWNYFYFIALNPGAGTVVGSFDLDDDLFNQSTIVIDSKSRVIVVDDEGKYTYQQVPAYAGKFAEEAVAQQIEAPKGKGAAKKAAKQAEAAAPPPPAEVEETLEEPAEEEDPLDALFGDE